MGKFDYEYILVFQDLFTRWVECVPIRKGNAKTVLKEFKERVVLRFGTTEVFLSDNGTEFKIKPKTNTLRASACITPPCRHFTPKRTLWRG